jgi:hypothetical protein
VGNTKFGAKDKGVTEKKGLAADEEVGNMKGGAKKKGSTEKKGLGGTKGRVKKKRRVGTEKKGGPRTYSPAKATNNFCKLSQSNIMKRGRVRRKRRLSDNVDGKADDKSGENGNSGKGKGNSGKKRKRGGRK